jgi:hypothetical protein
LPRRRSAFIITNIIINIIIHFPYFTPVRLFSKEYAASDQALLVLCSATNSLIILHVLSITAFFLRVKTHTQLSGQQLVIQFVETNRIKSQAAGRAAPPRPAPLRCMRVFTLRIHTAGRK